MPTKPERFRGALPPWRSAAAPRPAQRRGRGPKPLPRPWFRSRPRRRSVAVVAGISLTFGLAGSALAAPLLLRAPSARPAAVPSPLALAAHTTATAVAPPTPTPVTSPTPAAPTASPGPVAKDDLGPQPAGSASFSYRAGRQSWTTTANGLTINVSISNPSPAAGSGVVFTLSASGTVGCCQLSAVFGNGQQFPADPFAKPAPTDCSATSTSEQATTSYARAGAFKFLVQALPSGICGSSGGPGASLTGVIQVAPGSTPAASQGPALPTFMSASAYGNPTDPVVPGFLKVAATARDPDGWVQLFRVDWGDGTPATSVNALDGVPCVVTANGWPASTIGFMPTNPPASHQYASPGTYNVQITAISSGCNGANQESASTTFPFDWGPPEAPISPSLQPSVPLTLNCTGQPSVAVSGSSFTTSCAVGNVYAASGPVHLSCGVIAWTLAAGTDPSSTPGPGQPACGIATNDLTPSGSSFDSVVTAAVPSGPWASITWQIQATEGDLLANDDLVMTITQSPSARP